MVNIDITTSVGIATAVTILMIPFNKVYKDHFNKNWSGIFTIVSTFIACQFISIGVLLCNVIEGDNNGIAFIRGLEASFIAIGGYEAIKQSLQIFRKNKDK